MQVRIDAKSPAETASLHKYDSKLAFTLVAQWSWGLLSAPDVQKYAADAAYDQRVLLESLGISVENASKSLRHLAKLGHSGKYEHNIKR